MTQPDSQPASSSPGRYELLRALGPVTAMAIVVGNVIGSGIFLKPGTIAADAGDFRLIMAGWVAGGVLCFLGALSLAELAAMLPHSGGLYVYLREAYGRVTGYLYGWNEFMFNQPASIGALSVAFVGSLLEAAAWKVDPWISVLLSLALIGGVAWVNVMGVVWGGRVQNVVTWLKVAFLVLLAVLPFALALGQAGRVEVANFASRVPQPSGTTPAMQFGLILLAVMWAYNGWHAVGQVAEEIRDPDRNLPWALLAGVGLLMALYISVNVAYHGVLSMAEMAGAGQRASERMVESLLGRAGGIAMSTVIMCSTFGALNSNLLLGPRIAFAMGRDRVFFPILGRVHANYRTPALAIVVQATMAGLLVVLVAVLKVAVADVEVEPLPGEITRRIVANLKTGSVFDVLTDFVIFAASIFYALGVLAVIVLRVRRPEMERPYRTWGFPVVPLAFLAVYGWFLWQVYHSKPLEANAGLALIAAGLPLYLFTRAAAKGSAPA